MEVHQKYMQYCINLAQKGLGAVAPNPMVGSVIVYNNEIIGEGYHQQYGQAHAEVNAINSLKNKELLKNSTLYVNLEPCAHQGKTPPCANLIVESGIPKVVVGCIDSYSEVNGAGIEYLRKSGVDVTVGVLEAECKSLNKRFFTFHNKKRPYVILKWAQSSDGFIDRVRNSDFPPTVISGQESHILSHTWRSQEQGIIVATNTIIMDNPSLTTRLVKGKNPVRIIIDTLLKIPDHFNVLDNSTPTIIYNKLKDELNGNTEYIKFDFKSKSLSDMLLSLYEKNIQSVIVEGGSNMLSSFIEQKVWDELRVFIAPIELKTGVPVPVYSGTEISSENVGADVLKTIVSVE